MRVYFLTTENSRIARYLGDLEEDHFEIVLNFGGQLVRSEPSFKYHQPFDLKFPQKCPKIGLNVPKCLKMWHKWSNVTFEMFQNEAEFYQMSKNVSPPKCQSIFFWPCLVHLQPWAYPNLEYLKSLHLYYLDLRLRLSVTYCHVTQQHYHDILRLATRLFVHLR